ncbi:MAG TPA: UbiA family prenyltransferase [Steroidobacteraceae bacterium]|nr:UbiA family prenyltransferase [Steroidobacteraceae bacterium]
MIGPVSDSCSSEPQPEESAGSVVRGVLLSLRPYQWLKNALVFVPLAAAHRLGEVTLLANATRAFFAFGLCASSIYLINDVWDAPADRLHPHKQSRPIASGTVPRSLALALVAPLLAGAALLVRPLGMHAAATLLLYLALMSGYTLRLKNVVLLDSLILASGYALRVIEGGFAVHIRPSPHLLAFCVFLFFSLALVKRYAELALLRLRDGELTHARGYRLQDHGFIVALGTTCGALSALVLAMYMTSQTVTLFYRRAEFIWLTCILLLYWISHMWLTAHRGGMTDDPLVFALKNRTSVILIALMGATAWLAV